MRTRPRESPWIPRNNVYVTGTTASVDFPTAGAVFQPAYGGGNTDSFVAKLNPAGAALVYSSYLGGTNAELATGIAVDTRRLRLRYRPDLFKRLSLSRIRSRPFLEATATRT